MLKNWQETIVRFNLTVCIACLLKLKRRDANKAKIVNSLSLRGSLILGLTWNFELEQRFSNLRAYSTHLKRWLKQIAGATSGSGTQQIRGGAWSTDTRICRVFFKNFKNFPTVQISAHDSAQLLHCQIWRQGLLQLLCLLFVMTKE